MYDYLHSIPCTPSSNDILRSILLCWLPLLVTWDMMPDLVQRSSLWKHLTLPRSVCLQIAYTEKQRFWEMVWSDGVVIAFVFSQYKQTLMAEMTLVDISLDLTRDQL